MTIPAPHKQYVTFEQVFKLFNTKLFKGELPPLLITFRKQKGADGYYWANVVESRLEKHKPIAELAMNIAEFKGRSDKDILSTLLHEMVHHWQHMLGKPSRNGYHNGEWGVKMKEVGLYPSSTGQVGGKETGQKVSHYVIKQGKFEALYSTLQDKGVTIDLQVYEPKKPKKPSKNKKVKYHCDTCLMNVWGKAGLSITCTEDETQLTEMESESEADND